MKRPTTLLAAALPLLALFLWAAALPAGAQEKSIEGPADLPPQKLRVIGAGGEPVLRDAPGSEVESYCLNIADKAQDARYAMEKQALADLEAEIGQRIDELEARRNDYQTWLAKRETFLDSASSIVVDIYASMQSDAAAAQLAMLDRPDAASVIVRLKSRQASAILSEMEPKIAAEIASLIVEKTSTGKTADADGASQQTESRS